MTQRMAQTMTQTMARYFITISFDGTRYHGWQIQPNGITVQQVLEECMTTLLRQEIHVTGAGRTDAGVHARVMTAHFDWDGEPLDCPQMIYRLNRLLPSDIAVNDLHTVSDDMHARFSAKWRTYHYYVHTHKNPFLRNRSLETYYHLDFELMNKAGELLTHHKDFAAFCKAGAASKTTICELRECKWIMTSDSEWYMTVTANRFLRNMVRAIVGTMIMLGRHIITLEQFEDIVNNGSRSNAGESMPAKALFLWDIVY